MIKNFCSMIILFTLSLLIVNEAYAQEREVVTLGENSSLPLRILTRPMASLYADNQGTNVLQSNIPTFQSYFVYTRPEGEALDSGSGWYEVGTDDKGKVVGWMKADDVFEWRQTMCLAYTHPEGRNPVLMFEDQDVIEKIILSQKEERIKTVNELYSKINTSAKEGKPVPADFPIISVEPKMAVDIVKQFYLLPILEHKSINIDDREARLLRIAAVSNDGTKSRESSDIRENVEYTKNASSETGDHAAALKDLKIDLVWVMDTTRSMGPYIAKTIETIRGISKNISDNPTLNGKINFGVWAYRDSTSINGIEYITRNFTTTLQPVEEFISSMEKVEETKIDSVDMAEDMFAGISDAIEKTNWRDKAIRLIIVVADAPSHKVGHKWNSSGQDENTLRVLANERNINILALHLNPPTAKKYNKQAMQQLKVIAKNPGSESPLYWGINANNIARFGEISSEVTNAVVAFAGTDSEKDNSEANQEPEETSAEKKQGPSQDDIKGMLKAASVTWLGSETNTQAPRDVEAWVVDKDFSESTRESLEVRLLVSKKQLDSLSTLLKEVLEAGRSNQVSGDDFFTSLQAASAVASRDPDMLAHASSLAKSGMIPEFLSGLPYHSQLMDMNNDLWASWGPDEQDSFLNRLEAKVRAYQSIHDDPSSWVALNAGDDPSDHVAPIPLELMP